MGREPALSAGPERPRVRLWMKLAALAAVGVVAMHAVHLAVGNRVASRALADEQARLGRSVARLVARQAVDPVILGDLVTLNELVQGAVSDPASGVAYCMVLKGEEVVASSAPERLAGDVARARRPGEDEPLVIRQGERRLLDVAEPILGGELGTVRVGLEMDLAATARHELAIRLGLVALLIIGAGIAAAFVVGRSVARPVEEILRAADHFDPARPEVPHEVTPRGTDEMAVLAERFNRMMRRLETAHAEQVRARQKAVETERLAALGALVAGVAHEVNNPLAGLKNCVRRLERPDLPPAKRAEYLSLMGEGLDRIEEVVRSLLDFGRPHPTMLAPVEASRLAREATRLMGPHLDRRGIACRVVAGGEEVALADRSQVSQALVNLILNAAYVTTDGGEIRVRVRRRGGGVGLAVEDDGPGIPEAIRDRILDPFFSTKPEGEGTGLGLSVTRTIADAHGGELSFEFPRGGGTVATLWLRAPA